CQQLAPPPFPTRRSSDLFSFVTGESDLVEKTPGELIYAGGRQVGEAIEVEVVKAVSQSHLTRLWNNENFKDREKTYETFAGVVKIGRASCRGRVWSLWGA